MEDKKINCLNYVISDSYIGKKSEIEDDIFVQTQKMLDKKVKKELKQTLKHTKDLLTVDSSTLRSRFSSFKFITIFSKAKRFKNGR